MECAGRKPYGGKGEDDYPFLQWAGDCESKIVWGAFGLPGFFAFGEKGAAVVFTISTKIEKNSGWGVFVLTNRDKLCTDCVYLTQTKC